MHRQYPYIGLPRIHASLGYYDENRSECDRLIDKQLAEVDQWREQAIVIWETICQLIAPDLLSAVLITKRT